MKAGVVAFARANKTKHDMRDMRGVGQNAKKIAPAKTFLSCIWNNPSLRISAQGSTHVPCAVAQHARLDSLLSTPVLVVLFGHLLSPFFVFVLDHVASFIQIIQALPVVRINPCLFKERKNLAYAPRIGLNLQTRILWALLVPYVDIFSWLATLPLLSAPGLKSRPLASGYYSSVMELLA